MREIVVIGLDADKLSRVLPDALVYTDYDVPGPGEKWDRFREALDLRYRIVTVPESFMQTHPWRDLWPQPAHDWRYMNPGIVLCLRDDLAEAVSHDD